MIRRCDRHYLKRQTRKYKAMNIYQGVIKGESNQVKGSVGLRETGHNLENYTLESEESYFTRRSSMIAWVLVAQLWSINKEVRGKTVGTDKSSYMTLCTFAYKTKIVIRLSASLWFRFQFQLKIINQCAESCWNNPWHCVYRHCE